MSDNNDMKGYIMGSVVMRLKPDNKTLFGKTVYFDHNQGQVVAHDYWLKR
jgi:ribosomal protein L14